MTQQTPLPPAFSAAMPNFAEQGEMNAMVGKQAARFLKAQEAMLSDFEDMSQKWYKRRHQATHDALAAAEQLSRCATPTDGMQAMNAWLNQSMARLSEDAKDNYELMMRCFSRLSEAVPAVPNASGGKAANAKSR